MIAYSSFLKLDEVQVVRKIAGRDRYSCGGTKAGRLDHQRKEISDPFVIRCCVFGGRAWCFDETKEVVARISGIAAHFWDARANRSRREKSSNRPKRKQRWSCCV